MTRWVVNRYADHWMVRWLVGRGDVVCYGGGSLLLWLWLFGCGVPIASHLPGPRNGGVRQLRTGAVLVRNASDRAIPDSVFFAVTWINPVDDGRGALDSLTLRTIGIQWDSTRKYLPPFPTQATIRQQIPATAYVSTAPGNTVYDVFVMVTTFRRGSNAVPLASNRVSITLNDTAPPNVTGLTLTATKKP
jgi:hypothetical protein